MASFSTDGSVCIERIVPAAFGDTYRYNSQSLNIEFDITSVCQWINRNGYSKVCLQFPDTLLANSTEIYEAIRSQIKADLFILGDTTFSSCCVDEVAAMHVQADAVVHYGHSCFSTCSTPVFMSLPKSTLDLQLLARALQRFCEDNDDQKRCLFYDAAYDHLKDNISDIWFKLCPNSCIAHVDMINADEKVMGRRISTKNGTPMKINVLEEYTCIYLGSRSQTLFNCVISIKAQKWVCMDHNTLEISCLDESPWFKRRRYLIEKCKDAKNVGILVCKLSGQSTKDIIKRMQELCKSSHKKSYIVSVGKPNVAKLANFPEIDIYVMIACPESDLYNSRDFYKPLVYPYELEVAVNTKRPVQYNMHVPDFEDLLPRGRGYHAVQDIEDNTDVSLITGKIREIKVSSSDNNVTDLEKTNWAVETIGQHLTNRSWTGLEQNLGETQVKEVESGRSGLPISYENEPETH